MATPQGHVFELGQQLALDFVNTVGGMRGVRPNEHLHVYGDLLSFARQAGAITDGEAARLADEARRHPRSAQAAFAAAIELREALYRLFLARTQGGAPDGADLATVNAALARALAHRRLAPAGEALVLGWEEPGSLDAPLWRIADAAAQLLASDDAARVRVCGMFEEGECSWLFLDRTKGRTRRWCSMKDCGNRAKARRHYARTKCDPSP